MKLCKIFSIIICVVACLSALPSCKPQATEQRPRAASYYEYFDTVSVIFSYAGDSKEEFDHKCKLASEILGDYHKLFDIYYEYEGINNLKTVNLNAGKAPVKVDERLIDFLVYAKEMHALTGGRTNVAMGAVLKLWHDARQVGIDDPKKAYVPSAEALAEAASHTDIDKLIINEEESTVFLSDPAMSLDVGAVGKGYAAERAAEALMLIGTNSYVLNVGGNIRAIGQKSPGNGWVTGITNPDKTSEEEFVCRVIIEDTSLVTSGNYERYYEVDGIRYHHIIDPDTNMPAEYFASVSVFTKDSGLADTLSTALFCMSYEDGLALIESIGEADAIWVYQNGDLKHTDGIVFAKK